MVDEWDGRCAFHVRALKSKPAKPPKCSGLAGACRYAEKHNGTCQPIVERPKPAPQPSGNPGELPQSEPVHDFGWALAQMRAGRKVRRKNEDGTISLHPNGFGFGGNDILLTSGDLLATDWEVAE